MGRAYGTPIPHTAAGLQLRAAEQAALSSVARYYGPTPPDVVWRIEPVRYSACSLDVNGGENYYLTDPQLELFALPVLNWTEYGATLEEYSGARRRWVDLRDGHKQYASRSPEQALAEFRTRRVNQISILERQLLSAEREYQMAGGPYPRRLVSFRLIGLAQELLAWVETSDEPAVSLCADVRRELGMPTLRRNQPVRTERP